MAILIKETGLFTLWMRELPLIFFVNLVFMPQFGHSYGNTNATDRCNHYVIPIFAIADFRTYEG